MNIHKLFNLAIVLVFVFSLLGTPAPVLATSQASVQSAPFISCADVTEIPQAECEALVALYNSTNGTGWVNNTDWLAIDTPCNWYGVDCGRGHVTKLRLDANRLTGNIPTELGNLTQLIDLELEQNQLNGSIPAQLGNLTQLTWLGLGRNQLSGSIPAELGNLAQLTWLGLCGNQLSGSIPAELGSLTELTWLGLCDIQLTGSIPTELGNLTQLTWLFLHNTQLSGEFPASITNLVNLTTLTFECSLTSSDPIVIAFLEEKSDNNCFPDPVIIVRPEDNSVIGSYWPLGTLLMLEIDDSTTPQSPDYTDSRVVVGSDDWENGFALDGIFDIQPGHLVTVSGGGITKELAVAPLTVTAVDIDADTVSGTGDPGYEIHVGMLCDNNSCTRRNIYVDANGNWLADFSVPGIGEGETVFDIRPGSGTGVYEIDEDADATSVSWHVPNPTIEVRANYDQVNGSEWILGSTIMIEIDDPSTETNPDYADTATVGPADWDPSQTYFGINTDGYDLKLGDIVTVTDGDITKQLTVSNFMITDVEIDTDQVYGIADAGQRVNIWACWQSDPCVNRDENADQDGNWTTNFAVPGEQDWEQETADLQTGSWIDSSVEDEDGDSTMFGWYVSSAPIADAGPDQTVFAGATVILDASASSDPNGGILTYEWDLDNDGQYNDASSVIITIAFNQVGNHTIGLRVTDTGGSSDTDTVTVTILPWSLKGFYQPVDMNGVYNIVKGGSTVPLKFEIFAGLTELTDIIFVRSLTYAQTSCDMNVTTDDIETTATGGTSLRYDVAMGQFIYNWKTPRSAGVCYRVTMTTIDNSTLVAYFKLK